MPLLKGEVATLTQSKTSCRRQSMVVASMTSSGTPV